MHLTLWYTVALAASLLVFGTATYLYVRNNLFSQIEAHLDKDLSLMTQTLDKPLDEFLELETHTFLILFTVEQENWPVYISTGWDNANLNHAILNAPVGERWIWVSPSNDYFHLKRVNVTHDKKSYVLTAAYDSNQTHTSLARLLFAMLMAIPFVLLAGLAGGYFLAGRSLSPIQYLTQRARTICADNLSERLTVVNPNDELGNLTAVLNEMFGRLEESFHRLKRFTQDAAHELRTPLTVLRSVAEVGLQKQRDSKTYRDVIISMLEEVDRMTRLVDGLLTLARAEAGRLPIQQRKQALIPIIQDVIDCVHVLAEDKQQSLRFENVQNVTVPIDRDTLQLALMNLLTNAIRFTPEHGTITICVIKPNTASTVIEVIDTGPGIAPEHQQRVFERFYRVDRSRNYATGGTGLGLAIAKWAIEVNGGRLELESREHHGCCFKLVLSDGL